MNMKLSVIVITKNEETTIARCIKSVAFADEIIVIDAQSTDATPTIAQSLGAVVYTNPWPGFGAQKNYGASRAHGEWLLFIDADEEVPAELSQAIRRATANPAADFYWLRIVTVFLGSPLTHLFGHNPRLFKRAAGQWTDARVHEQVRTLGGHVITLGDTQSRVLTPPLLHHSHPTLRSYFTSMHTYTTLDAAEMYRTKKHRSGKSYAPAWWLPAFLALRQFFKLLVYRGGLKDGFAGLAWSAVSGLYEWELASKFNKLAKQS